jgi:RNA polymerase sigma-70 factor, ECF subfamily
VIKSDLHLGRERPIDEARLIDQARAGDRDAQEVLVRRYFADVYALALRILGEPDQAADAAQDAMINALNGLARFRGEASLRTWLLRITANSARSAGRRSWRRREVTITAAEAMADGERDPESNAVLNDEAGRAAEMLERLPPKQRMAVHLRIRHGLSYAEVGDVLDCSEGAARVNYHLGIKRLREMMQ